MSNQQVNPSSIALRNEYKRVVLSSLGDIAQIMVDQNPKALCDERAINYAYYILNVIVASYVNYLEEKDNNFALNHEQRKKIWSEYILATYGEWDQRTGSISGINQDNIKNSRYRRDYWYEFKREKYIWEEIEGAESKSTNDRFYSQLDHELEQHKSAFRDLSSFAGEFQRQNAGDSVTELMDIVYAVAMYHPEDRIFDEFQFSILAKLDDISERYLAIVENGDGDTQGTSGEDVSLNSKSVLAEEMIRQFCEASFGVLTPVVPISDLETVFPVTMTAYELQAMKQVIGPILSEKSIQRIDLEGGVR